LLLLIGGIAVKLLAVSHSVQLGSVMLVSPLGGQLPPWPGGLPPPRPPPKRAVAAS
jgi:hypothetical protein